jgi:hypothetical protein
MIAADADKRDTFAGAAELAIRNAVFGAGGPKLRAAAPASSEVDSMAPRNSRRVTLSTAEPGAG